MNKLAVIYGLPRGGTSLVAGILHHAGFDMGDIRGRVKSYPNGESYPTYEDRGYLPHIHQHTKNKKVKELVLEDAVALRRYVNRRLIRANGRPAGVKMPGMHLWSAVPDWVNMPVVTIRVVRPLADSVASSVRKNPGTLAAQWESNGLSMLDSMDKFEKQRPPLVTIDFYGFLDGMRMEPDGTICSLLKRLEPETGVPLGGWNIKAAKESVVLR